MSRTGRGKEALTLLRDLGEVAESTGRVSNCAFVHAALCKLSVALANSNGRMYMTTYFSVSRAHGHDYRSGDAVLTLICMGQCMLVCLCGCDLPV